MRAEKSEHQTGLSNEGLTPRNYLVSVLCDRFETEWKSGSRPNMEAIIDSLQGNLPLAKQLAVELVSLDRNYRSQLGEHPAISEYLERFSFAAEAIQQELGESWTADDPSDRSMASTVRYGSDSDDVSNLRNDTSPDSKKTPDVRQIGRYQLTSLLGRGGSGEVWKGFDLQLRRHVAVKLLRTDLLFSPRAIEAFLDEGRKLAQLQHPGIVTVYDVGREDGQCYLISELATGGTLTDWIKKNRADGAPPLKESVAIVAAIAEALHYAHLKGLVHRDVKPLNILFGPNGSPRLADFGLATSEQEQLHEPAMTLGTFAYMSPEQIRGESHLIDPRSDIYNLGAVLYELLTGRRPFICNNPEQYREQILYREVRPPRTVVDTIPAELERVVLRCLAKPVRDRYTTAADLAAELQSFLSPKAAHAESEPAPVRATQKISQRSVQIAGIGATVLLLCTLFLFVYWDREHLKRQAALTGHAKYDLVSPVITNGQQWDEPNSTDAMKLTTSLTESIANTEPAITSSERGSSDSPINLGNGWQDLLAHEPVQLTEPNSLGSRWSRTLKGREYALEVVSYKTLLIELGSTQSLDYTIQMRVSQPQWGSFSVFFGCRPDEAKPDHLRFGAISFQPPRWDKLADRLGMEVDLTTTLTDPAGDALESSVRPVGQVELPSAESKLFQLVVVNGRVSHIKWGTEIFETIPETPYQVQGQFGIILTKTSAVFRNVYFKDETP